MNSKPEDVRDLETFRPPAFLIIYFLKRPRCYSNQQMLAVGQIIIFINCYCICSRFVSFAPSPLKWKLDLRASDQVLVLTAHRLGAAHEGTPGAETNQPLASFTCSPEGNWRRMRRCFYPGRAEAPGNLPRRDSSRRNELADTLRTCECSAS